MCTGHTYHLLCGHTLSHFSTRCPQSCPLPYGPIRVLHDTCAPCTPSFQLTNIRKKYDRLRWERMEDIREAQAAGDREEEDRLTRLTGEDAVRRLGEMKVVGELERKLKLEGGGKRVVWPGKDEDGVRRDEGGFVELVGGVGEPDANTPSTSPSKRPSSTSA
ncbi:hypothetical protein GE09DRAFT_1280325 [Coniochaeta sp. 2T2.1]|nr:hypothetical protein GE09DRAFT_1280325 [Coniochaeta sp. 2T2.1]